MKHIIAIILSIALSNTAHATAQASENITVNGVGYLTPVHPLESYKEAQNFGFLALTTANYRGYQGTWEVKNNRLYLVAIDGRVQGKDHKWEDASLERMFPGLVKDGKVDAIWFSGTIYAPGSRWGEKLPDSTRDEQMAKATLILKVTKGTVVVIKQETNMHWAARNGNIESLKLSLQPASKLMFRLQGLKI